jgi:ABC-type phosphate transport system auxiliary subunit
MENVRFLSFKEVFMAKDSKISVKLAVVLGILLVLAGYVVGSLAPAPLFNGTFSASHRR